MIAPRRLLRNVAPSLLICLVFYMLLGEAYAQDSAPKYLSDTDAGYKALAGLQKAACDQNPNRSSACYISTDQCMKLVNEVLAQMHDAIPNADQKMIDEVKLQLCNDRATPYEFPGMRSNFNIRMQNVRDLSKQLGVTIPDNIIFGGLEISEVNAEVEVETNSGQPLIMINRPFIEFANEMIKLVVQSMVISQDNSQVMIDGNSDSIRRRFENDPEQRKRLADLIDYFYGKGRDKYTPPTLLSGYIQNAYTDGIETFAVAHEVGHIIHKDPASSLNFSKVEEAIASLFSFKKGSDRTCIREMNADAFGAALIAQMHRNGLAEGDLQKALALYAVEFYFITHKILLEAGQIAGYTTDIPFDKQLVKDVPVIVNCINKLCNLSQASDVSTALRQSDTYPPDELRRQVIEALIRYVDKDAPSVDGWNKVTALAEAANRNAEIFWSVIKPDYITAHSSK